MTDQLPNRRLVARLVTGVAGRSVMRTALSAGLLFILAGCDLFPLSPPERNPSVVGVIESAENTTGVWHYELEDGESADIDFDETVTLPESTGGGPGALLFYGGGDDAWFFTLREPHASEDGYRFNSSARDDDTHIVFENGLRLPKAAGFDGRGWPQDGRYDSPTQSSFAPFCINPHGEVTVYLAMPSDRREGCPDAG